MKNSISIFSIFYCKNAKALFAAIQGLFIGSLLDTPMLAVNIFYPYTFVTKKNDIFVFKKIKDKEGQYLNFVKLINNNFYDIYGSSYYNMKKNGYSVVENSEDEILEATKEFLKINDNMKK